MASCAGCLHEVVISTRVGSLLDEQEAVATIFAAPKLTDHHRGHRALPLVSAGLSPGQHGRPDVTWIAFWSPPVG